MFRKCNRCNRPFRPDGEAHRRCRECEKALAARRANAALKVLSQHTKRGQQDRDCYTDEEIEFILAMERYQNKTGKKFPSYAEVLQVAKNLGYRKIHILGDA